MRMYRNLLFWLLIACLLLIAACDKHKAVEETGPETKDISGKPDGYYANQVMIAYEQSIIEAINQNKFSLVEGLLDENGPLYQDQKKLVKHLNESRIKEKLIRYEIKNIYKIGGVYKFYVVENTELYHPDRKSEIFQYEWIYTVKEDPVNHDAKVYSIERWNH